MAISIATALLGKNGPQVSRIGYGAMGLSAFYGKPKPDPERFAVLDSVVANGCTFIDSSDIYGDSEVLLGQWFAKNPGLREKVFLATKFAIYLDPKTGARSARGDPEYVKSACEKSLKRLGLETIDLYYVHRIDKNTPIEVTMRALKELVDEGKIKYIGLSECSAATLERAYAVHPITACQMEYSPWSLDIESSQTNFLETARKLGVAIVAYSPVGRGMLTGRYKSPDDLEDGDFRKVNPRFSKENFPKNLDIVNKIQNLAERKGCTAGQLTLAWILAQGDNLFPIPGSTNSANIKENLEAAKISLSAEEEKEIRQVAESAEVAGERYEGGMMSMLFADTPAEK